jgi:single-strand DNA-binding protein
MSNSVTLVGNLTRDPELRYTPSGAAVAKFGIAVNRFYTNRNGESVEQTDFFTVNCWRQLAEHLAESVHKGNRVIVTGRVQSRSWEGEDGQKRTVIEIEADDVGPSLRWATAAITKATRGGPGEWNTDSATEGQGDSSANAGADNEEVPAATQG